ncbi:major head protein [Achromobacter phage 2-1]|nr:major head protein [Achromobacter phage 2-1]
MDLIDIKRQAPEDALVGLKADSTGESVHAGQKLVQRAKDVGLNLRDYLVLAIDPRMSKADDARKYEGLNGYEAALAHLNLPVRNDLEQGVILQAASETFQTYPGTRAMFPEVMDDVLRWKNRQDQLETVGPLIAQSRTINGAEMISTFVEDDSDQRGTYSVSELGRIPVRSLRTTQQAVGMFKHGSGYRTSYEFNRRASLDIMTPFAARVARELEISKVRAATSILINGDGVNAPAPVVAISSFDGVVADGLSKNYKALAKWLMQAAKEGRPIDTIIGNYDIFVDLLFMFQPTLYGTTTDIEKLVAAGTPKINTNIPLLNQSVNFQLSSTVPEGQLVGYTKAETLEELLEAGSNISENERSIVNQAITYVRSENTGYRLVFGDTRSILNTKA